MIVRWLLERPLVYRLWQAPFVEQKLVPLRAHNDLGAIRRVLDVGCGPGTNTRQFAKMEYVGLDINEHYVEFAKKKFGRDFVAVDVTKYTPPPGAPFDFIFLNSFLHHVNDEDTRRILAALTNILPPDGHVHILELVLPERPSIARFLAKADRGEFPRPLEKWREIFTEAFEPVVFEPYRLTLCGVTLWNMVYFKGRKRA